MDATTSIGVTQAMTQQAIATTMVKVAADASQKMADLLAQMVDSVPVASGRGGNVNFSV